MSKPPDPSPSSRAWTLTTTSSPSSTGPVSRGYAMHGTPSTSKRTSSGIRSTTALTQPRRRLSAIARGVDQAERDLDHRLQIVDGDPLGRRVDVDHAVREVDALEAAFVEDVRV